MSLSLQLKISKGKALSYTYVNVLTFVPLQKGLKISKG